MPAQEPVSKHLKVFISYTHDSSEHSDRVLKLSNALRERAGINCDIDQYHSNQSWPAWMEERLEWADRVLVVCTRTYLRRWQGKEVPGVGLGARWESFLTKQILYENPGLNEKFIPVVFGKENSAFIPMPLRDVTRIELKEGLGGFEGLRNRILGIAPAEKPSVNTSLLPIERSDDFFSSTLPKEHGELAGLATCGLREEAESLFTNLFPVDLPSNVHQAKLKEKNAQAFVRGFCELWRELGNKSPVPLDFLCERGHVYSFSPFNTPIWKELERAGEFWPKGITPTKPWAQTKSAGDKSRFIKLLNRSLDRLCSDNETPYRLTWSKKMACYLFARKDGLSEGTLSALAIRAQASRTVFKSIPDKKSEDPKAIQHWKHVAFRHRFVRFDETWYLVLRPFWAFTSDGFSAPSRQQKKASFNMQKPEKNRAVLGHVMFWASVLCRDPDLLENEKKFRLRRPSLLEVSPSVRDSDWIRIAEKEEKVNLTRELDLPL
ncbi:MAG: toll/interleukin-1 receptor domain-containing protein [Verrucomicrobiota bacterium]